MPYEEGLAAVEELRPLVPAGATMTEMALRWILMFDAVSVVIPGAKTPAQARANVDAAALAPLPTETMARIRSIYERRSSPPCISVGERWRLLFPLAPAGLPQDWGSGGDRHRWG